MTKQNHIARAWDIIEKARIGMLTTQFTQEIGVVFIDEDSRAYLSITGSASVIRDTAKAKEIWKKTDDIWLQGGPDDPNVRVLRVEPITAELWDGPSSAAGAAFEFAKARLTGEKLNFGENRKGTAPVH